MWLKINYNKGLFEHELFQAGTISVELTDSPAAPITTGDASIRLSKIFPLVEGNYLVPKLESATIYFFEFVNAFRILGRIKQIASPELSASVYCSCGTPSVILIATCSKIEEEFFKLEIDKPRATEKWLLEYNKISSIDAKPFDSGSSKFPVLVNYSELPLIIRTIIDEFAITSKILESKMDHTDEYSVGNLNSLIKIVNIFIRELNFLATLEGDVPETFYTRDKNRLAEPLENQILRQQIVDRLIQINSSISYVSTQTYSGSIPILERRSLIRRSSLLGIGSAIKALNRIVDYIEESFALVNYLEIITNIMHTSLPLPGMSGMLHSRAEWYKKNIDTFTCRIETEENIKKLAYFSSRQAYRESEYSITASLNSVPTGLSLEWTLMTITHEMLHSNVRLILTALFYEEENSEVENYQRFYSLYEQKILGRPVSEYTMINSVREAIFTYCLRSLVFGSLTSKREYKPSYETKGADVFLVKFDDFYASFESEYRNLNEIFVHVLDLHYFYGGRTAKYIPIIWCSWSAVPHVNADIRQYILRSLLAIASKIDQEPFERWNFAIQEFKDIIHQHWDIMKNIPLIARVLAELKDTENLKKYYWGPFKNSLIIVDLAIDIFYSKKIRGNLWNDENITVEENDDKSEGEFSYDSPMDFIDAAVNCPIPYLFDRMIRVLNNKGNLEDVERSTALTFLAINSK